MKAHRKILVPLVLALAVMLGCNANDDAVEVQHPSPTAIVNSLPSSPTIGQTVTLDGTGSKTSYAVLFVANPANLTLSWSLVVPASSAATLSSTTTASPTFTPDLAGAYEAGLTVTDPVTGKGSVQSFQTITVAGVPDPTAVITAPTTGTIGNQVSLSGATSTTGSSVAYIASPANLTFLWALTVPTNSTATLSSTTTAGPVFTPDLAGTYTVSLTVTDVATSKVSQQVQATVAVAVPDPTATIMALTTGTIGNQIALDGTSSTTSYGVAYVASPANLTFLWVLAVPTNSTATLSSTTVVNPTFTPDLEGTYTVSLTVTDVATSATKQATQVQIAVASPKLTVALTGTPVSKRLLLTGGTAVFPITLSANSIEDLTITGLTIRSSNDATVYQVDLYGGTSPTLVTTYLGTGYANSGVIMFSGLTINVPASGSYYLGAQTTFMTGVAGQTLSLSMDLTQDITAVGAPPTSFTLSSTTSTITDQIIGPAGAGAALDTISWEEWVLRDSLIQATMPNEVSGSQTAPNGANQTIARLTLTPQSNVSAFPYVVGVFVKVVGKAQTGVLSAYQGVALLGQSAIYHDSRKRIQFQDVPASFADGAESLHWIPFTSGLLLSSATVIEIQGNAYTVGGSTTSWPLTASLCLDSFVWGDNGNPTNPNSTRTSYLDITSGALLSPTAAISFAGGTTAMPDPGIATMVAAQATVVQATNSEVIVIWNRPVWKTQGYGAGYFNIWDSSPASSTSLQETFATIPAPTMIPRNWVVIRHNNAGVTLQTRVDLVTNPTSPTLDTIICGADGTSAVDHSLVSAVVDCR